MIDNIKYCPLPQAIVIVYAAAVAIYRELENFFIALHFFSRKSSIINPFCT